MQRITSIYDWQKLPVGEAAVFPSDLTHQRAVRLRVNAPSCVTLWVSQDDFDGELFLAAVEGLDEIQFEITGPYKLFALGGDVWFDTLDGSDAAVEAVDPTSFTNIVERRARNPEMELLERKMQENLDRRTKALMAAFGDELAERDRRYELERAALTATSATASGSDTGPVSPGGTAKPAIAADGGEPKGDA